MTSLLSPSHSLAAGTATALAALVARQSLRRLLLALVLLPGLGVVGFPLAAAAQSSRTALQLPVQEPPLTLHAYRLEHQSAFEALQVVASLLSQRGTVELKPQENTLVLRDNPQEISRLVKALDEFDHPRRDVEVEIQIIQATLERFSPAAPRSRLPEALLARLRDLLPYHTYRLVAGTRLRSKEGEQVSYQLANRFRIDFQVGTLLDGRRLRLRNFKVANGGGDKVRIPERAPTTGGEKPGALNGWDLRRPEGEGKTLIHTTLNLHLDRTLYLGLAPSESSAEALMLVLTVTHKDGTHKNGTNLPGTGQNAAPPAIAGSRRERSQD